MTSLVLPAYNPGSSIIETWYRLRDFVDARPEPWEVVIVLDGCTDSTAERIGSCEADRRMRVIDLPMNRGKGHAVRTGLLAARGEYRLFTDIDLAYDFEEILRVANALRAGAPVAIASRTHPDSELQLPAHLLGYAWRRQVQSAFFGRIARGLLPIQQTDTQAGLKGLAAGIARHILPLTSCDGFGFDCELLTACARGGIPVREVPVRVRCADRISTTGAWSSLMMLRELWSIRNRWKNKIVPAYVATGRDSSPVLKAA